MPSTKGDESEDFLEVIVFEYGTNSFRRDLAYPFLEDAVGSLVQEGPASTYEYPIKFAKDVETRPTAMLGVNEAIIGISLFYRTPIGQWAFGRFCDEVWDEKIRPAMRKLFLRRKEEGTGEGALTLSFGAWFNTDRVFIQVIATLNKGEDAKGIDDLVPEAFRSALTWIEQHGVQAPVLVYRIIDGNLSSYPTLAEIVPRV
ncbi:MAG TPA: hypothetical protein VNF05_11420 [Acidimicrobiales bacterium]|nr:hypothetical protein [Acidimicrobiales bacterium]